jgi:hypothetical protein
MNATMPVKDVSAPMCGKLELARSALDFLHSHVRFGPNGSQAAIAIQTLSQHLEMLALEAQRHSVQQTTVVSLMDKLTLTIACLLQMSSRIELLTPGLAIELALIEGQYDGPSMQAGRS